MQDKLKNTVIVSVTLIALVPFVLLNDLFPFFRFAMFAEPVKSAVQTEYFEVTILTEDNREEVFNPAYKDINSTDLNYLCRNYFYRKQGELFLVRLSDSFSNEKNIKEWRIKRTIIQDGKPISMVVSKIKKRS
jgi:hypothetical protein